MIRNLLIQAQNSVDIHRYKDPLFQAPQLSPEMRGLGEKIS